MAIKLSSTMKYDPDAFFLKFLQPAFRHKKLKTQAQMARLAGVLYGGIGVVGFIALLAVPTELSPQLAYAQAICLGALVFGALCYRFPLLPLWVSVVQVPIGVMLVSAVYFLLNLESGTVIGAVYVLSSMYAFHFFRPWVIAAILLLASLSFSWVSAQLLPQTWLAVNLLLMGLMLLSGWLVRLLLDRIHQLAHHDRLTQLLNRYSMEEILDDAFQRNKAFSAILLDLNNFKPINDQLGHQQGDRVLKRIATELQQTLPPDWHAARWGGDEFLLYCPQHCVPQVHDCMNRLEHKLEAVIGLSWGLAESTSFQSIDALLRHADEQMYADKANKKKQSIRPAMVSESTPL